MKKIINRLNVVPKERTIPHFPPWPYIPDTVIEAVNLALLKSQCDAAVLSSIKENPYVSAFESAFASYLGTTFALAVNSGASALHLSLIACGISPGDEVILPAYGWGQILVFLDALDAVPVFVDIEPETLCIDVDSVSKRISKKTRAVVVTHFAGCPADMESLLSVTKRSGVTVIEDCAQALGAKIYGKNVGTWGDIGVFSCGPKKHLPCGEGGMLVTNNHKYFERAVVAGQHPDRIVREITDVRLSPSANEFFWPYRIHPLSAVMGCAMLSFLKEWHEQRKNNHRIFLENISPKAPVCIQREASNAEHAWGKIVMSFLPNKTRKTREAYVRALNQEGIPIAVGPVRVPLHERSEVINRWGEQHACPAAEEVCLRKEVVLWDSIGWVTPQQEVAQQVASAFA